MKRVIQVPLTVDGINRAIKELRNYKAWLTARTQVFVKELAKEGMDIADIKFHWAVYDGTNDVTVKWEDRGSGKAAVVAVGSAVLFIEFGTGVHTWPDNHPEAQELGMKRGEYGKGYGKRRAWVYRGDPGTNGIPVVKGKKDRDYGRVKTYGNPANMSMYQTEQELRDKFEQIARQVFACD